MQDISIIKIVILIHHIYQFVWAWSVLRPSLSITKTFIWVCWPKDYYCNLMLFYGNDLLNFFNNFVELLMLILHDLKLSHSTLQYIFDIHLTLSGLTCDCLIWPFIFNIKSFTIFIFPSLAKYLLYQFSFNFSSFRLFSLSKVIKNLN